MSDTAHLDTAETTAAAALALLDPAARGPQAALSAFGTQLERAAMTVPDGVTAGDIAVALRDTTQERAHAASSESANRPAADSPAIANYLQVVLDTAAAGASLRTAHLPGYDVFAPIADRLAAVQACTDARGLALALTYEPNSAHLALVVAASAHADEPTLSRVAHRWVTSRFQPGDEERLVIAQALVESRPDARAAMEVVSDGCVEMVLGHAEREDSAAYTAATIALRAQLALNPATPETIAGYIRDRQLYADHIRTRLLAGETGLADEDKALTLELEAMREHHSRAVRAGHGSARGRRRLAVLQDESGSMRTGRRALRGR